MAEDESKESEEVAKGGKPWLALLLMVLVVPAVTLAITEFVVIPRIQNSVATVASGAGGENAPASGGGKQASGHGVSSSKRAELGGAVNTYVFDGMVANLAGAMGTRFIKTSFEVRGTSEELSQILLANESVALDAIISALSSESIQSLEVPGGRNRLRLSLIESINQSMNDDIVEELYFTEFMIQ
jgi:flagellar FliL protein